MGYLLQPKHVPTTIRPHPNLTFYQHAITRRVSPRPRVPSQDFEILLLDHNCGSCAAEIVTRSLHVFARATTLHRLRGLQTGESARHVSEEEDVGWMCGGTR